MTMPETAMHETDSAKLTEDEVGRPRELPIVKPVPETARMQRTAKHHLRFRVLAAYFGHHSRPNGAINYIDHGLPCVEWEERRRVRIPRDTSEALKEGTAFVRTIAQSEREQAKAPIRDRYTSLMDQLHRRAPISHLATRGSRLAIDHPATILRHAHLQPPCHD